MSCMKDGQIVSTEKKTQPKSWDYVLFGRTKLGLNGRSFSDCSDGLLQRGEGRAGLYRGFCMRDRVVGTSKDYC